MSSIPRPKKVAPATLRSLGLNEKWLQDQIEADPSLLGLGDLQLIRRERSQSSGGRLDFLLYDPDQEVRYEVEVMLGSLDESHIIRTIEYWDLERQRFPTYEHRAVIVAEEITARFFNVVRLLNRAVPLIAVQLSAFPLSSEEILLHGVTVLDIYEEADSEAEEPEDITDRRYWEARASRSAMTVLDELVSLVNDQIGQARVTYNKSHVAVGTTGRNFCWLHPPREASHCHVRLKTEADRREAQIRSFEETGLYVRPFQKRLITLKLSSKDLAVHRGPILALLRTCEEASRRV